MKIIITLCDPIKRFISDFLHSQKSKEKAFYQIRKYRSVEEYLQTWIPKIEKNLESNGRQYLNDIYHHDILASLITNG